MDWQNATVALSRDEAEDLLLKGQIETTGVTGSGTGEGGQLHITLVIEDAAKNQKNPRS